MLPSQRENRNTQYYREYNNIEGTQYYREYNNIEGTQYYREYSDLNQCSLLSTIENIQISIRWIRNILDSWIRIRKNMRIYEFESKGQNTNQKLLTKIFCS